MGFVVSNESLDTGDAGIGALTGLTQGLAHGLQIRRQEDLAQQHFQLQQQEHALRQQAYAHGLQNEADIKAWAQRFGEFKAWDAAGAGSQPLQGPPTPGSMQQAPGGVGPPSQGPDQPLGMSGPDQSARMAKIMDLARSAPNLATANAFIGAVHQDDTEAAINAHASRIRAKISDKIAHSAYTKKIAGGAEDPAPNAAAELALKELDQFMASPEAKNGPEAAKFLDHLEKEDGETSKAIANHNTQVDLRHFQGERMRKMIEDKWTSGTAITDLQEPIAYMNTYMGSVDDNPKDLATVEKEFNEAISGTGQIKREAMQHRWENEQLRAQNQALWQQIKGATLETPDQRAAREKANIGARADANYSAQHNLEDQRQQGRLVIKGMGDQASSERTQGWLGQDTATKALVAAQADPRFGKAKTPAERQAIIDEYAQSLSTTAGRNGSLVLPAGSPASSAPTGKLGASGAGTGDSASSILEDFRGSKIDKAAAIKRAQALGFKSFEELQKAAGGK